VKWEAFIHALSDETGFVFIRSFVSMFGYVHLSNNQKLKKSIATIFPSVNPETEFADLVASLASSKESSSPASFLAKCERENLSFAWLLETALNSLEMQVLVAVVSAIIRMMWLTF
jgi:hypothetical protein